MILLDTCVLLWLSHDPTLLPQRVTDLIEASDKRYLSSISCLEIGLKVRDGQLQLPLPFDEWLFAIMDHLSLEAIEVNHSIAYLSTQLPLIHRDPFDRLLVATALLADLTLITPDGHIPQYPGIRTFW
jgi:PIN domain nuclease of toxin-antitoxin system